MFILFKCAIVQQLNVICTVFLENPWIILYFINLYFLLLGFSAGIYNQGFTYFKHLRTEVCNRTNCNRVRHQQ